MKIRCIWFAFTIILALALGAGACGGTKADGHAGHGVVVSVDADGRTVSIDHEEIPGFMKAMTMTFNLAHGVALEGIDEGARVDFRVKQEGGVYTVIALRHVKPR